MFQWPRFEVLGLARRDFSLVFTLLFNAFTWSYMIFMVMERLSLSADTKSAFMIVFYVAAAGAGLSGALFTQKIKRLRFLYFWMVIGLFGSLLLIFSDSATAAYLSLAFISLGISFGLGMPSALAYLADHTSPENRGMASSLIFLTANLSALPLAILFTVLSPMVASFVLVIWRGLGLVVFIKLKPKDENGLEEKKTVSYVSILQSRPFSLYFLPWIMLLLVDSLEKALLEGFIGKDFLRSMLMVEPMIAVVFTLISGIFVDRIGRKRMVIYGFISLGIGYAAVGLAPTAMIAWYFYILVDAAAWGILLAIFLLILWGDLSDSNTREKYYAVGIFPFMARNIVPLALITFVASVPASAAFSLASFFLFLAVLPLMYAPETLPEKRMELTRARSYIDKAKKLKDKYLKSDAKKG